VTLALGRPLTALLLVVWSTLVWWALTSTRVGTGPLFPGSAFVFNLGHAGLFGLQALLLGSLLRPGVIGKDPRPWLLASCTALLYSGVLEWRQGFIDGRSASGFDLVTNAVGAFGVPWVLSQERFFTWRLGLVACAALVTAGLDTAQFA
jgi:VanZ family protein